MSNSSRSLELPEWIVSNRPQEYRILFEYVKQEDGLTTNSEKVKQLLLLSGLRQEFLSFIWSACNKQIPGILTEQEFYIVLAFVALAQRGSPLYEPNLLKRCIEAPIPNFGQIVQLKNSSGAGGETPPLQLQPNVSAYVPPINNAFAQQSLTRMEDDEFSDFQSASSFDHEKSQQNSSSVPFGMNKQAATGTIKMGGNNNFKNGSTSSNSFPSIIPFESPINNVKYSTSDIIPNIPKTTHINNSSSKPFAFASNLNPTTFINAKSNTNVQQQQQQQLPSLILPPQQQQQQQQQPSALPNLIQHNPALNHMNTNSNYISNQAAKSSPMPNQNSNCKNVIGSRLANYDLGVASTTTFATNNTGHFVAGNSDLLIGDEDKYSALRNLNGNEIENELNREVIGHSSNGKNTGEYESVSVQHQIYYVSDDVLQIVKTEKNDFDADFGDFQSSSPIRKTSTPINKTESVFPNNPNINFKNILSLVSSQSQYNSISLEKNYEPDETRKIQNDEKLDYTNMNIQNNSLDEFGDFVSSPCDYSKPAGRDGFNSINETSPKIIIKNSISSKKFNSSTIGTNSSKNNKAKPQQIAFKINSNRIVKASNFLIDSPTTPPEKSIGSLDLENSNINNSKKFSFIESISNLDLLSVSDIESLPTITSSSCTNQNTATYPIIPIISSPDNQNLNSTQNQHREMVLPLKTTLIGKDFDDNSVPEQEEQEVNNGSGNIIIDDAETFQYTGKLKLSHEITSETQSLSSLDLGNYNYAGSGADINEIQKSTEEVNAIISSTNNLTNLKELKNVVEEISSVPHSHNISEKLPIEKSGSTSSNSTSISKVSQAGDKYSCFKEEIENERERHCHEWSRAEKCCLQLITYAVNIFNSSSSSGIIREVVSSPKGIEYIESLIDVYHIGARIYRSWLKIGGNPIVRQLFQEISSAWDNLAPFLLGTPLMGKITSVDEWTEGEYTNFSKLCGLCLIVSDQDEPNSLIEYEGIVYHSTCINLWINCIDQVPPSLTYIAS